MGTRIEAVSALTSHGLRRPTARGLADAAVQACLEHAGKTPGDVDMLINAGVYREDNMGEPALAALIQQDIGANPAQRLARGPNGHGTFSFDLINGTCGVISAIQVESGLLRSGVIRVGAIVTSDVDPDLKDRRVIPFRPAGAAMLLGWDDRIAGFTDFRTETFPEYDDLFVSGLVWREQHRNSGRSQMVIEERPGYRARLVDCAGEAARRFLGRTGLEVSDIDLLVPAPAWPDFVDPLRRRLGVPGDRIAYVAEDLAEAYTAGPIAALQAAVRSGRLSEARNVVLLAAGAGITVSLALYRQTEPR